MSLFLCMVWGCVPVPLIYMRLSSFPSTICWKDCFFPMLYSCFLCRRLIDCRCLGLFLENYSVPLICVSVLVPVPHCLDYCGSDTEKLFDTIQYHFVIKKKKPLRELGIKGKLLTAAKNISQNPTADIILNDERLKTFSGDQEQDKDACFHYCYSTLYWMF